MKLIPLTQGKCAMVDNKDFEWLNQWKWHFVLAYAKRSYGPRKNQIHVFMHREIMREQLQGSNFKVDHIDGNTLNNKRMNLRLCTVVQNGGNRKISRINTSGFKGVSWKSRRGKWEAAVKVNGKSHHLGSFSNSVDAAQAYNEAALKHFGEFARLNDLSNYGLQT